MFSDDRTVIEAGKRGDSVIIKEVHCMYTWFYSHDTIANTDKWESVCFDMGKPENIKIKRQQVGYQMYVSIYDLYIVAKLEFREHPDYVEQKLNILCGLINRDRHVYTKSCLLLCYNPLQLLC